MNEALKEPTTGEVDSTEQRVPEIQIWAGFAISFFAAFLIAYVIYPRLEPSQIGGVVTVAMSVGFINHGIWHRQRIMVFGSCLSLGLTLMILAIDPRFFAVGWIVMGSGQAFSGLRSRMWSESAVGSFVILGSAFFLLSVYLKPKLSPEWAVWMIWMALVGLIFITVGRASRNPVTHCMGAVWILVTVVVFTYRPLLGFPALAVAFAAGMGVNIFYLYRILGRAPKIGELFSYATRALFLRGLTRPIDQYRVLVILISGNIGAKDIIHDILSRLEPTTSPVVLLGPTAPTQLDLPERARAGWVTTISGVPTLDHPIISPEDPTAVSVFLTKAMGSLPQNKAVIVGDFLDNMIPQMDEGTFYKYYSDLASGARVRGRTLVLIVKADIHREVDVQVLMRFADVIIENREREERGRLVREVRVSNLVDNINTDWERC